MRSIKRFILLYLLFTLHSSPLTFSQTVLRSVVRGTVADKQTQSPLPGATVILLNSDPIIGTTTDADGKFRLENVPIGKQQVKVTYVGYAPFISDVIPVSSGKQAILEVVLQEMVVTAPEVEIKGDNRKFEVINRMATVSVRSFNTEETNRFAGSYGDPARMAANFAGVTSGVDNRNDIIVRGNTPMGLQWRIDEMEIPNPNHFAAVGTTGGPVTVLNNNLLANSDFLTGAFPAQYGNALSGIFDMKMRSGNTDRREYWFQVGWNGLEFGTEGPFSKRSPASYIFSYRYSLLKAISLLGIDPGVIPEYQDVNLKITIPTKKAGTFTLLGIGGLSYIELNDSEKPPYEWTFVNYGENLSNGSNIGVFGVTHTYFFNPRNRIKTMAYIVGSKVYTAIDTFTLIHRAPSPWAGELSEEVKLSASVQYTRKFDPKNTVDLGILFDHFNMDFHDSVMYRGHFRLNTDAAEQMRFLRGFVQYQHRFNDKVFATMGLFGSWLTLNQSFAVEPRFGLDWIIRDHHTITFGAGLYSQMQPRVIYFVLSQLPDGSYFQTNRELDFTRNAQAALGYNYLITEHLRFKTEVYYQYLYDIPVKPTIPEYALINQGHEFFLDRQYADSLMNNGTGHNYGVEFTLERFLYRNYYFLFTTSLFNSNYRAYDKELRNTAFDVNYALNALAGYEFKFGKKKRGVMSFGFRATWAGGNPYVPYDVDQTVALAEPVYNWEQSYVPRYPDYKRFSLRFGIKRNRPKQSMEFIVDLQYRTNYTNIYLQRIDSETGQIKTYFAMGFFPMGTWRIQF
jgi:hypothetical protein